MFKKNIFNSNKNIKNILNSVFASGGKNIFVSNKNILNLDKRYLSINTYKFNKFVSIKDDKEKNKSNFPFDSMISGKFHNLTKRKFHSSRPSNMDAPTIINSTLGIIACGTLAGLTYLATRYKVATANEYLVRTGIFIDGIHISKKAFLLPYQTLRRLNMEPITYHCTIDEAMSNERISFNMPTVFTIGPNDEKEEFLITYSKLLLDCSLENLKDKIIGIIMGESRALAGKMKLDDLFNNRQEFKSVVVDAVNERLACFGLKIYNANIGELCDKVGNEYFTHIKRRSLEGAMSVSKIGTAEKQKEGEIGESEHNTEKRQALAQNETRAKLTENEKEREVSESLTQLTIAKAEMTKNAKIAEAESIAAAEKRRLELQKEVEQKKNAQMMESLRATDFTAASVKAEVDIKKAEGNATAIMRDAEGKSNAKKIEAEANAIAVKFDAEGKSNAKKIDAHAEAEAIRIRAEAEAEAIKIRASAQAMATKAQAEADGEAEKMKALAHFVYLENEAKGVFKLREAEAQGIFKLREAEAQGLEKLIESAGGVSKLNQYLMVKDNIITQVAEQQAKALHDMKPNVNVWQTGKKEDGVNGLSGTINEIIQNGLPLLDGINKQYGIDFLKSWKDNSSEKNYSKINTDEPDSTSDINKSDINNNKSNTNL